MHPYKYCTYIIYIVSITCIHTYIHLPQQHVVSVPNRQLPFLFDGRSVEGHTSHLLCQRALRLHHTWIQTPPSHQEGPPPWNWQRCRPWNFMFPTINFQGQAASKGSSDFSRHIGIMRFPTKVDDQSLRSLQRKPPHWFFCQQQQQKKSPTSSIQKLNLGCFPKSICLRSSFDVTKDPL